MLVISRKSGEQIQIGNNVTVTVWRHKGQIKLGIDAPKEVRVTRPEAHQEKAA